MSRPVFEGKGEPREWLANYEWFMFMSHMVTPEEKLYGFPLVMHGEARVWYEALENQVKQNWDELKAALIARFGHRMTPMEVDEKLQNLHQDLKEDFQPFLHQFEDLWL